jgi:hypothetical protein
MISTMFPQAAQRPSHFAMPISGAISGTGVRTARGTALPSATCDYVVRDRHVADVFLAQDTAPGPTTWSPPIR